MGLHLVGVVERILFWRMKTVSPFRRPQMELGCLDSPQMELRFSVLQNRVMEMG